MVLIVILIINNDYGFYGYSYGPSTFLRNYRSNGYTMVYGSMVYSAYGWVFFGYCFVNELKISTQKTSSLFYIIHERKISLLCFVVVPTVPKRL